MDSHSSATKGNNFNMNFPPNQDMLTKSTATDNVETGTGKRRKIETDPLKIESVLEIIFGYLDVDSIKNARQVNPLWSVEGAKALITKCFIEIPWYLEVEDLSRPSNMMDQFKAFLSHKLGETSKIPKISIESDCHVAMWESLGVLGRQLNSLKFTKIDDVIKYLPDFLTLLPNLKYLSFKGIANDTMTRNSKFIMKVLTAVMSKAEKNRNPLVISFFSLATTNMDDLEDIVKFGDCSNIMIEELECRMNSSGFSRAVVNIISKLLSTNRNTLEKLTLRDCELCLSLLKFPCMTALTDITLFFHPKNFYHLLDCSFPPNFRFFPNIPNLQDIRLYYQKTNPRLNDEAFFPNLFGSTGTAQTVKSLWYFDLSDFDVDLPIDQLLRILPNLQNLWMKNSRCSLAMFNSIWNHGLNLRKLDIGIYLDQLGERAFDLDVLFTGFTPETVGNMKKMLPNLIPCTRDQLENLRVNPSILNLKELKELNICIYGNGRRILPSNTLAVSANYAFQLMPKLAKVFIHVEDCRSGIKCAKKALVEVSKLSYVIVEFHEHLDNSSDDSD